MTDGSTGIIEQAKLVHIEDEAARRAFPPKRRQGKELVGPCPICGEGDDRFSINVKSQLWHCRRCDAGGDVIELVMLADRLDFRSAVEKLAGSLPVAIETSARRQQRMSRHDPRDADESRMRRALRAWAEATDPRGTPVEIYLRSRGLELPDETAGEAIRYHAHCAFGAERHPAMVCLVRNIVTNEPQAIHRTALGPDGRAIKRDSKTFRMSFSVRSPMVRSKSMPTRLLNKACASARASRPAFLDGRRDCGRSGPQSARQIWRSFRSSTASKDCICLPRMTPTARAARRSRNALAVGTQPGARFSS